MIVSNPQASRQLAVFTPLGDDVLLLSRFQGCEAVSELFDYELQMLSREQRLDPGQMLGTNIAWRLDHDAWQTRYFNGHVAEFRQCGKAGEFYRYTARVVPWLWFLTQTTDCRIFQNMTTPEIVERIFADLEIPYYDLRLTASYKPREYCVQYRESDFQFVSRLLEEEGIYYYFQHTEEEHRLVLADHSAAWFEIAEQEVVLPQPGHMAGIADQLKAWHSACSWQPGGVAVNDYNFHTPRTRLHSREATLLEAGGNGSFELYDYPGRYASPGEGRRQARLRMQARECQHEVITGEGTYRGFSAGGRFKVTAHRDPSVEGKQFAITRIETQASIRDNYQTGQGEGMEFANRFSCIPAEVPFRPMQSTPKAIVEGPQTAVVVGPAGEEIYTDELGRVKVQFHWDREGRYNEHSSCWVRVSQTHAGQGWGAIDIPRIGEEVIVSFLEGDPDRPIIKGRSYNAGSMPPFALPGGMTRSGMKSNTHKGSGYNEMTLDDTAGNEQIRVNAQHNMDTTVGNSQTLAVGVDRSADVGNNDTLSVGVDSTTEVGNNQTTTVGNNDTEVVGNHIEIEAGTSITLTCGASTIHMNQAGVINIRGNFVTSAATACNSIVAPMTQISGSSILAQAGLICLDIGGATHKSGGVASIKALSNNVDAGKVVVKGAPIKIGEADAATVIKSPASSNGGANSSSPQVDAVEGEPSANGKYGEKPLTPDQKKKVGAAIAKIESSDFGKTNEGQEVSGTLREKLDNGEIVWVEKEAPGGAHYDPSDGVIHLEDDAFRDETTLGSTLVHEGTHSVDRKQFPNQSRSIENEMRAYENQVLFLQEHDPNHPLVKAYYSSNSRKDFGEYIRNRSPHLYKDNTNGRYSKPSGKPLDKKPERTDYPNDGMGDAEYQLDMHNHDRWNNYLNSEAYERWREQQFQERKKDYRPPPRKPRLDGGFETF